MNQVKKKLSLLTKSLIFVAFLVFFLEIIGIYMAWF